MSNGTLRRARGGGCGGGRSARRRRAGAAALAAAGSLLATAAGWPTGVAAPGLQVRPAFPGQALAGAVSALVPGGRGKPLPTVAAVGRLQQADVIVVSAGPLPPADAAAVARLRGVTATESLDAARLSVNGRNVAVLGVDPSGFRRFAAKPTAVNTAFWRNVAAGDIGLSYLMGKQDNLPPGTLIPVIGQQRETLLVGGLGTVGIAGVDAVVSHAMARSLGFPMGNALVISATPAGLAGLVTRVKARMPRSAMVEQLVASSARPRLQPSSGQAQSSAQRGAASTQAGAAGGSTVAGLLSAVQVNAMLRAALSRVGMPYVWGAAGPSAFDCSGLVQWSFARAGVVMPRVAADQARTGPAVPVNRLQPGDLLFYHTDPTAPGYISHVAIYLGNGQMVQAPQPGMNVEVAPLVLGSEFAGAVDVSPQLAARVAGVPVG